MTKWSRISGCLDDAFGALADPARPPPEPETRRRAIRWICCNWNLWIPRPRFRMAERESWIMGNHMGARREGGTVKIDRFDLQLADSRFKTVRNYRFADSEQAPPGRETKAVL